LGIAEKILNFFRYLLGKSTEIPDLDRNDVLLGKVVLDIHRKKRDTEMAYVPLSNILPIHPIDREEAIETMKERAAVVREHQEDIASRGSISSDFLNQFLPSVSNIKVADLGDGELVSFEGNGRLGALREALGADADFPVEIEQYRFDPADRAKLRRRIRRLRHRNGSTLPGKHQTPRHTPVS
jgi:hypothetical protein